MSGNRLPDVRETPKDDLRQFFLDHGEKPFRTGQVWEWLWSRGCTSFDGMTNLPASLRTLLKEHFTFYSAVAETRQHSSDGTVKTGFRLHDGLLVEGVLIPSGSRATACISSQVGCSLGCTFCATGQLGFTRNLSAGEIFDQVTPPPTPPQTMTPPPAPPQTGRGGTSIRESLSNIVFMGMGEPFLNYENVTAAIGHITAADGLGMSPQRITVSSVGLPKMIRKMADDDAKYHFALSLHAATDEKRNRIIPFNLNHPLAEVSEALKYYHKKTGKRFTIEYILFGGFNDAPEDAASLAAFCRSFPVKVNLIEYNPVRDTGFSASTPKRTKEFVALLEKKNMVVNVRNSRGKDIDAACGQLAGKLK